MRRLVNPIVLRAWMILWPLGGGAAAPALAVDAAQLTVTMCAPCHGADGNSTDHTFPKLAGMDQEYLLRQLKAFSSGRRRDERMVEVLTTVDPADFVGLASYYGQMQPKQGKVTNAELAAKGKVLFEDGNTDTGVPACAGCHQPDGRGNARFPRLAGQHQGYVLKQLADYRSGRRATDPLMTTVGKRLTDDEAQALAEYISGM